MSHTAQENIVKAMEREGGMAGPSPPELLTYPNRMCKFLTCTSTQKMAVERGAQHRYRTERWSICSSHDHEVYLIDPLCTTVGCCCCWGVYRMIATQYSSSLVTGQCRPFKAILHNNKITVCSPQPGYSLTAAAAVGAAPDRFRPPLLI